MKKIVFGGCMVLLLFILLAGCNREVSSDVVVARVNGVNILASDVYFYIPQIEDSMIWDYFMMYGEFEIDMDNEFSAGVTFGRIIKERAVQAAAFLVISNDFARQLGLEITPFEQEMIDNEMQQLIAHFGQEELDRLLHESGFRNLDHYAEFSASYLLLDSLINKLLDTPAEFARFAHMMPPEDIIPELLGAKHILVHFRNYDTEEEAEEIALALLERALAGEDFDMLIETYGQDPGMQFFVNGYSFASGEMMPEFEQGTRDLEMGEISGLVRTDFGFHIIKRVETNVMDWHMANETQPRTTEDRMVEAIFRGLEEMVDNANIEFLPALDDM